MAKKEDNLKPCEYKLSQEEAKRGGIASGEARRRKRDLKLAMQMLLEQEIEGKNGEKKTGAEAIAVAQFKKALKGDTRAFEVIRDTAGQSVVQKVAVAEVDNDIIKEIEDIVSESE